MLFSSAYSFNFVSSTSADVDESKAASNSAEVGRTDDIQQVGELICSFGEDNDKSWRERGRGERERETSRFGEHKNMWVVELFLCTHFFLWKGRTEEERGFHVMISLRTAPWLLV